MTHPSPLHARHAADDAMFLPYGPPESAVQVVGALAPVELEYAALRKGCLLADLPHRATLEATGPDRVAFLNSMLTQELKGIAPFEHRASFWLSRKGRIVADLRCCELGDRMLIDLDVLAAPETLTTLSQYLIAEDAALTDATPRLHRLALHGPTGPRLLALAGEPAGGPSPADLAPGRAGLVRIARAEVVVERLDTTGEVGLELTLATEHVSAVWDRLLDIGRPPALDPATGRPSREPTPSQAEVRLRPGGWLAINTARIEAGTPIFNIDFSTSSLPGETGLLRDRVSFKKGCYLGQEIVARMDSRKALKQTVVALRFDGHGHDAPLPVSGTPLNADTEAGEVAGVVTSSTISPMLGAVPIALGTVRAESAEPGTRLSALTPSGRITGTVQPHLRFWPPQ